MCMKDEALDLLCKRDFSVIPLGGDDGKKPLLSSWLPYQNARPTEDEVEGWWTRWPDANLGIITGPVSGLVVVDADGEDGLRWLKQHLPPSSVYVKTGKGFHAYYRHPGTHIGNKVRLAPEIDIRADGGYVVAPPSIHKGTGKNYEWLFTPGLGGWDGLPQFPVEILSPQAHGTGLGIDLSNVKPLLDASPVEKGQRNQRLAELCGKWLTVNRMEPAEVLLMARGWNSTLHEPLPDAELRKTVESICKTHMRNHPVSAAAPDVQVVPDTSPAEAVTKELPEEFLHPGGYLHVVMDYIRQSSAVYHPVFGLASALALLGTLIGQKYQTETGLRTNLYCVALGFSGSGKNGPCNALPSILQQTHAAPCWGGNDFTSEAALLKYLAKDGNQRALAIFDEMGLILNALRNPNNPAHALPASMMRLFSGTTHGYAKRYADEQNTIDLKWHHFSFIGFSTPVRFWESMTMENAKDGFLARCLVFDSRVNGIENPDVSGILPDDLKAYTDYFADYNPPMVAYGIEQCMVPQPKVIARTPEADAYFRQFKAEYAALRDKYQETDEARASIYNRAAEHAAKIALIHAASTHMEKLEQNGVGLDGVKYACGLVKFLIDNMIQQLQENIAENDFHKLELRAMKHIRTIAAKSRNHVCPAWKLMVHLKGATPKQIEDVIRKLTSSGQILEVPGTYGGKQVMSYAPARVEEGA